MPVMNVNLVLDDATYAGVKAGIYELGGLVKNADNKRVKKHLPTVVDATKEGAAKAIDMIREHKKGLLVIGGVLIVGGAAAGAVTYISQKDKIKAKKKFGEALEVYLNAAKEGTLTSNLIDDLLASFYLHGLEPVTSAYLSLFASQTDCERAARGGTSRIYACCSNCMWHLLASPNTAKAVCTSHWFKFASGSHKDLVLYKVLFLLLGLWARTTGDISLTFIVCFANGLLT